MTLNQKITNALHYLIPAYIFLLPLQTRYIFRMFSTEFPYYSDLSLYLTDILFFVILALAVTWLASQNRTTLKIHPMLIAALIIGAVLLLYAMVSASWAQDSTIALWKWGRLVQAYLFFLILIFFPVKPRLIIAAFLISASLQGIVAIFQFFTQQIPAMTWLGISGQDARDLGVSVIEYRDERWLRAYGSLPHPNILGGILATAFPMLIAWYFLIQLEIHELLSHHLVSQNLIRARRPRLILCLSAYSLITAGLLCSFSRSAWLGAFVGSIILVISLMMYSDRATRQIYLLSTAKLAAIAFSIAIVFTIIFGPLWTNRLKGNDRLAEKSYDERAMLTDEAKTTIVTHPYLGVGIGNFIVGSMQTPPYRPLYAYQPVHNTWLLLWAELGLIGLIPFILWFATIISWFSQHRHSVRIIKKGFDPAKQLMFAIIITVGVIAYYDHYWWTLPIGLMMVAIHSALFLKRFHG